MKTLNTTSEFKAGEKSFGFIARLHCALTVDGVFNLPREIRKQAFEQPGRFGYQLFFLGLKLDGGRLVPRRLTEEELEAQEALAAQTKGKKKEAPVFEDRDLQLPPETTESSLAEYYEDLESELCCGAVKFLTAQGESLRCEEDLRERDLVLFEESLIKKRSANLYFVVYPLPEESTKSRVKTQAGESGPELQVFTALVDLEPLWASDSGELQGRFTLSRHDGPPELLYAKLSFKTDINLHHEYRAKFGFDLREILRKEVKPLFPLEVIEARFAELTGRLYSSFSQQFEQQLMLSEVDVAVLGGLGPGLAPATDKTALALKELAETVRARASKHPDFQAYKRQLSHLLASQVYQKYKLKDLHGVYFNNNDLIYSESFNVFSGMVRRFGQRHLQAFQHERGLSVPLNSQLPTDYRRALEQATSTPAAEHFEALAREYWLLGAQVEADKAIDRALALRPDSTSAHYFKTYQRLSRREFAEAEALIAAANAKWGDTFEANYRLLLLYVERVKIKEAVFILRFLLEKHDNPRLFYAWLAVLGQRYLESSGLAAYFQAKLARSFESEQVPLEKPGSQLVLAPTDELFSYEFGDPKATRLRATGGQLTQSKLENTKPLPPGPPETPVPSTRPDLPEAVRAQRDEFYITEASLALEWGFPKSAALFAESVSNKDAFAYRLLSYRIARCEDQTTALQRLQDLNNSPFAGNPQVLFETFTQLITIGFMSESDEDILTEQLFDSFESLETDQQLFVTYHTAGLLLKRGEAGAAEQVLLRGLDRWPHSVWQWTLLGKSLLAQGKPDQALQIFAHANLLDNHNFEVLVHLACCLARRNESRLQPVLQDLRGLGLQDRELTLQLIRELEETGFATECSFFKRNFFVVFPSAST